MPMWEHGGFGPQLLQHPHPESLPKSKVRGPGERARWVKVLTT